ncbi:MAG: SUMF1/EgtB/PvdO family nonheme iron enzyme [SAR324 cluster bacterium]|nr:SUMF1/EgtB/PvdO family nonheme iron enzyme [SAR324 cluster bacterium]
MNFFNQSICFSLGFFLFAFIEVHAQVPNNITRTLTQLSDELIQESKKSDPDKPLIVVLEIRSLATNNRDALSEEAEALLIDLLNQKEVYPVVEYSQVQIVRQEWNEAFPDSTPEQVRKNLTDLLGADWLITGTYRLAGASVEFQLQLHDASTSELIWQGQTDLSESGSETAMTQSSIPRERNLLKNSIFSETLPANPFFEDSTEATENSLEGEVAEDQDSRLDQGALVRAKRSRIPEKMVFIAESQFLMGSFKGENDERPVHLVNLQSYLLDRYEVTNAEFDKCIDCERGKGGFDTKEPEQPVVYVDWENANKYCQFAGKRLPSEAEWEKGARAGTETEYFWGDTADQLDSFAWYQDNAGGLDGGSARAVGSKKPNGWGLYDMYGNVMEWTRDWYSPDFYQKKESSNLTGPPDPIDTDYPLRAVRGGAWGGLFGSGEASQLRSAKRFALAPWTRSFLLGFRCAADWEPQLVPEESVWNQEPEEETEKEKLRNAEQSDSINFNSIESNAEENPETGEGEADALNSPPQASPIEPEGFEFTPNPQP